MAKLGVNTAQSEEQPKLSEGAVSFKDSLRKYWYYGIIAAVLVACAGSFVAYKKRNMYAFSVQAKIYLAPRFATVLSEQKETDFDSYQKMKQFQEQQALMVKSYQVALDTLKKLNMTKQYPEELIWIAPSGKKLSREGYLEFKPEDETGLKQKVQDITLQWKSQIIQNDNKRVEALLAQFGRADQANADDQSVQEFLDQQQLEAAQNERVKPPELIVAENELHEMQKRNEEKLRGSAEGLAEAIQAVVLKDTYLMNVSMEQTMDQKHVTPLDKIINTLVEVYIEKTKTESFFTNKDVRIALLNTRREQLIKKINHRMAQRTSIAQQLGVTTFSENTINPFDQLLLDSKTALEVAQRALIAAKSAKSVFEDDQGKENRDALDAASFEMVANDPTLNTLKGNVNLRRTKLLEAVSGMEDSHPLKKNIDRELKEIDEELARGTEEVNKRVARMLVSQKKNDVAKAKGVVDGINQQIQDNQAKANRFSEKYNLALGYNNEIRRFQSQLEEIEIRKDKLLMEFHAPSMARLESAALEPAKGKGGWKKFAVISGVATLLIGLILPFLIDMLKYKFGGEIRTTNQVHNLIGFKPLAGICESGESLGRRLVLSDIKRRLAIALEREHKLQGTRLLLFTSVRPGAGVSTLAFEMGLELCDLGIKALVVEVNAAKPDPRYQVDQFQTGLIELINGEGELDDAIIKADGSLPDRMSVGGFNVHSHLFGYDKLREILISLQANYDVVLLDAPSILGSADAEFLATIADLTLLVVKARAVKVPEFKRSLSILEELNPKAVSVILTNLEVFKRGGYFARREEEYNVAHEDAKVMVRFTKQPIIDESYPSMKPIFLYALHSGNLYGTERMALYTMDGLRDSFTPVLLVPPGPALIEAEKIGIQAVPFRNSRDFARRLRHQLSDHKQIAFAATGVTHSLAFNFWNFFYRRHALHLHLVHGGTDERESYGRKKMLNGKKVTFVAVSDYVKERLIANGVDPRQIIVVGNFLPDSRIKSAPRHPPFTENGISKLIVVSRVDPIKRVDLLLDALDRHPELNDLPVRVFGTGWDLDGLRARAEQSHPNVVFEGFSADVAPELANSDLLLHLCPVEPFGLAILEGMAAGIPVMVPDQGGASGLLKPGNSGFHFRADDADDLAMALLKLRNTPAEVLNAVVQAADQRLQTCYSSSACLENYRKLYAELLDA
jgi:glycosyltransferase involved in cell wall biosynthesis/Mrp family chromosome partitioning ATPase